MVDADVVIVGAGPTGLMLELCADERPLRRIAALVAGTDLRHPPADSGHHVLTGTFARDLTLGRRRRRTGRHRRARAARRALPVVRHARRPRRYVTA
jgi:hypothetical protein